MKNKNHNISYRPEIDGLRAIAVLAVIAYHAPEITFHNFSLFKGGYLGVDIFFVISGYLITSIISKEIKETGNFSFKNFYQRRIRRIIPVLFALILVTYFFSIFFLLPSNLVDFSKSSLSTLGFSSNFYFYFLNLDYSQFSGLKKPLLHTWSLSIEEQFYIFYPVLLILLIKQFQKNLTLIFWFIFLTSFFIASIQTEVDQILSFYSLHSRIWEFSIGALASIYFNKKIFNFSNFTKNIITLSGVSLIIASLLLIDHNYKHPSYYTLIPVIGTFLIIIFSSKTSFVTKILSSKIFVWIGLISYSLYMWHYPIFAYADLIQFLEGDIFNKSILTIITFIALIFLISIFSYFFIEKPFRNKSFSFNKVSAILAGILILNIGLNFYSIKLNGEIYSENVKLETIKKNTMVDEDCKFFSNKKDSFFLSDSQNKRFSNCKEKYKKFVLIIGDSHAGNIFNAISKSADHQFILGLIKDGCRPTRYKECQFEGAKAFISKEIKHIKEIIITQKGSFFLTNTGNPNNENFTLARKLPILKNEIQETVNYLKTVNKIFPVIFIGPHIEPNITLSRKNIKTLLGGELNQFEKNLNLDLIKVDEYLEKIMNDNDIRYISKINQLKFNFKKDYIVQNKITFSDVGHWSDFGEYYFGNKLIENEYLRDLRKGE